MCAAHLQRNGYPYTLWNRDQNPQVPMRNTYGSWPFVMVLEQGGVVCLVEGARGGKLDLSMQAIQVGHCLSHRAALPCLLPA